MTSQEYFDIRKTRSTGDAAECPVCGDSFTLPYLAVFDGNNEPLCYMCAWDKAPEFAGLLKLRTAAHDYAMDVTPPDVVRAVEKRKSDPKRLKRELQEGVDFLDNHGHASNVISPLAVLLAGKIKDALKSKNVETMKEAKRLFEDSRFGMPNLDDEIPF